MLCACSDCLFICDVSRILQSHTTWPPAPAEPPGGETWHPALGETCPPLRMNQRGSWERGRCLEKRRKMEMERNSLGMAWRGEDRVVLHFKYLIYFVWETFGAWWQVFFFLLFAQGLSCHPSIGSVRGRGFGPGWRGSVGAVAWSPGCCWGGHEEKGQGAGYQRTAEERTALR